MNFIDTETYKNLALSFSAESMAGLRYQILADLAVKEGYMTLADTVKEIAKNETMHAKEELELLNKYAGDRNNIDITGDFPFVGSNIPNALSSAIESEKEEGESFYPRLAEIAKKEGYPDIAAKFQLIAKVEITHRNIFQKLLDGYNNKTLFKSDKPRLFVCSECGHSAVLTEGWNICPLCGNSQGYIKLDV